MNQSDDGGKYGSDADAIRKKHSAHTVILIVIRGDKGSGFTVATVNPDANDAVPSLLRRVADNMDALKQN